MMKKVYLSLALILLGTLTCCSLDSSKLQKHLNKGKLSYSHPERYTPGSTQLSQSIAELNIDWVSGSVIIQYDSVTSISFTEECKVIDSSSALTPKPVMQYYLEPDGTLNIAYDKPGKFDAKQYSKDLLVVLPYGTQLREVNVNLISGQCTLNEIAADEIELDLVNGSIVLNDIVCKELSTNNVNGSVLYSTDQLPDEINFNSFQGSVNMALGGNPDFRVKMNMTYGKLLSTFPCTSQNRESYYGKGLCKIEFNGVNGTLSIDKRNTTHISQ